MNKKRINAGLPHSTLLRVQHALNEEMLRGLVAIFTRRDVRDTVCFYLDESPLVSAPEGVRTYPLSALDAWLDREFEAFDDLTISWLAIDVAYPDIPTKGTRFYALEQEYRRRGMGWEQRRIWAELASHFLERMEQADERFQTKILQLITPTLLEQIPRRGLVGIIPHPDLTVYVHGLLEMRRGGTPVPNGPLAILLYTRMPGHFPQEIIPYVERHSLLEEKLSLNFPHLIFFEELYSLFGEDESQAHIIDLRHLLYTANLADELPTTLEDLIEYFATHWQEEHRFIQLLGDLWLERRLREMDGNDLVGAFPQGEPSQEGFKDAFYLYRRLPERWSSDPRMVALRSVKDVLDQPRHLWFSLLPLSHLFGKEGETRWHNLGPLFYRAGRTRTLARNAWLLVQEIAAWDKDTRAALRVSPTDELRTMIHSCALLGLENPWDWRQGRYIPMLMQAYEALQHTIERLVEQTTEPHRLYYQALGFWYRCALATSTEEIREFIEHMESTLAQFHRLCREHCPTVAASIKDQATHLHNLSKAILHLLRGGGQPDVLQQLYRQELEPSPGGVSRTMRHIAEMPETVDIPTRLFQKAFQRYAQILIDAQNIQRASIPVEDKIRQLEGKVRQLRRAQRVAYALYHETRVLEELYDQTIRQTESVIDDLARGAHLALQMLTRSAPHHQETHLTFEIRNIGRVPAQRVTVELALSEAFRLLDESAIRHINEIPPDDVVTFGYTIRPETDENIYIRLNVTYTTSDAPEPQVRHSWDFPLQVVSLDQHPFTLKANPYIYGVPLQEPRLFYGRREELLSTLNHLANRSPQNILVRGARRSGKTSLLYMIKAVLEDRDRIRGARNRFDIPRDWDASLNAVHPLFFSLQSIERLDNALTSSLFFKTIIRALKEQGLALPNVDAILNFPTVNVQHFERYLVELLHRHPDLHIVLLLDEFDVVDLIEEKVFYAHLRHIISSVQRITWIIASALGLYREVSYYESPLFNVFKIVDLGPLDRDAARRLILDPWETRAGVNQGATLQIVDDAVDAILQETARYPYFIQLLCSEIVGYVNRKRTNYVLRKTVYEVIDSITDPRSPLSEHFAYLWDRVDGLNKLILLLLLRKATSPTETELLQAVRSWLATEGVALSNLEEQVKSHLQYLEAMEAVIRDRYGRLQFGIPLFRRLLRKRSEQEDLWGVIRNEMGVQL